MYPTYTLQMWHRGIWNEIGWRASTPKSHVDLEKHAEELAAHDPDVPFRLVALSAFIGGEVTVVRSFNAVAAS